VEGLIDVYYTSLTSQLSLKNAWLPHIFFLDANGTYKDLLSTDSFKPHKNITVFESITDRKTQVSRDAQNVCAIIIVGTALKPSTCKLVRSLCTMRQLDNNILVDLVIQW